METTPVKAEYTAQQLREFADFYKYDNQEAGTPGYCEPKAADWTMELLPPAALTNIFANAEDARAWMDEEIKMDEEDKMNRGWSKLLVEDIREEVTLFIRDGKAYVWDGWHRTAAAIIKGVPVLAIVGRPKRESLAA
jgi:hypothetical protein